MTVSTLARMHGIHPVTIHKWKREVAVSNEIFQTAVEVLKKSTIRKVEVVKKVIQLLSSRGSKNRVRTELKVGRASLYWKRKGKNMKRVRYQKKLDSAVLVEINLTLETRPSYGHKRVTAMINKKRRREGLSKFNRKRIYKVMEMNGLLLKKEKLLEKL